MLHLMAKPSRSSIMKILLLGDYSNCHNALAVGLRRLGCDVTVASDGSTWQQTGRQVDLARKPGKLGGLQLYLKAQNLFRRSLSGYDVVAINDVNFMYLKPARLREIFDVLKKKNGKIFLTAMSTDIAYLDMLQSPEMPLRYSEWFVGGEPSRYHLANRELWEQWHAPVLTDYQNYVFDNIDGAVSVLYEYHLGMKRRLGADRAFYGGLPIDTAAFSPVELPENPEKVRLFLGRDRKRKMMKGSDYLEIAAQRVVRKYPDRAELVIVENRPFAEFIQLLRSAHVVLDQIYSYTPATTALMAMAYGLNTVSGAEPEYYDFIGETANRPIINAPIELDALTGTLEQIVLNGKEIRSRGVSSRRFVEQHNDSTVVARRFLDAWNK